MSVETMWLVGAIVAMVILVILVMADGWFAGKGQDTEPLPMFVGLTFVVAVACWAMAVGTHGEQWYRQGQIDAANGIMKYEKQQQPNGEVVWKEQPRKD